MSERYGTPGELREIFEAFEDWLRDELTKSRKELKRLDGLGDPRYEAGRLDAFRDALAWLRVDDE